jgi:hypothetical protein
LTFLNLDDVSTDLRFRDYIFPLLAVTPIFGAYGVACEKTAKSLRELISTLHNWWYFGWFTIQTSVDRVDEAASRIVRSRTANIDDDDLAMDIFFHN